jgi:hypothetical protein
MNLIRAIAVLAVVAHGFASCAHADPAATKATATVSGSIVNNQGVPLCGLVLANGLFMFSCSPNGTYSLSVPLDANGQITLFGFVDGHFPFKTILTGGGRYDMTLNVATAAPVSTSYSNTQRLIGGTWTFTYTILGTFSDRYSFNTIVASTATPGDYNALGTDAFGSAVIGSYSTRNGSWAVLDPGTIIDRFFVFDFGDTNHVSGCYYQISPPGTTNLSRCYSMSGFRSSFKEDSVKSDQVQLLEEVASDRSGGTAPPEVVEAYLRSRSGLPR